MKAICSFSTPSVYLSRVCAALCEIHPPLVAWAAGHAAGTHYLS